MAMDMIANLQDLLRDPVFLRIAEQEHRTILPPVSLLQFEEIELFLECKLPSLLKRIYTEVSNGGIGPQFGLFPLETLKQINTPPLNTVIETDWPDRYIFPGLSVYSTRVNGFSQDQIWLSNLINIAHGGCFYSYHIYANENNFPVIVNEEPIFPPEEPRNYYDEIDALTFFGDLVSTSFDTWIEDWLSNITTTNP